MSLADDIAALRRVALFADLDDDQLRLLAFSGEGRQVAAGEVLFEAGAPADGGFVVASGRFELSDASGSRVPVEAGPGAVLTVESLLVEGPYAFRALAAEPADVFAIRRAAFRRMLSEYPAIAGKMHARLAAQLSALAAHAGLVAAELGSVRDLEVRTAAEDAGEPAPAAG